VTLPDGELVVADDTLVCRGPRGAVVVAVFEAQCGGSRDERRGGREGRVTEADLE
jgi:hypothetical protein